MNLMEAVEHVFSNYGMFEGRARRSEFWYFQLFHFLIMFALGFFSLTGYGIISIPIYFLASIVPNFAVGWRRFHDIGRSGVWYLISLIPIVGTILIIAWLSQDSQPGNNQYGPNPKGIGNVGSYGGYYGQGSAGGGSGNGHLAVQCITGPLQGQTYPIRTGEMLFGREGVCAVKMPDGTPGISRRHACIRWQQGMPVLIDLGSSYGTYLADGKKLPPNYPESVAAGTRFYLGNRGNMFQIVVF